jgi:acetyl-CoA acyltransferase
MHQAVIVDAVRTPSGKNGGKLKDWHPASLGAHILQALAARNPIDIASIDDVIFGCVMQVGPQTLNVARNAVLTAGWPEAVPGTTVDRQCGSSQQAIHFAAQGVMAGAYDAVVAGGVEAMSQVPLGASLVKDMGFPFPPSMLERYEATGLPHQGIGAEMIADEWGLSRSDLDAFGALSQQRAARATDEGRFEREIVAVPIKTDSGEELMRADEGIRPGTTAEKLANLKPAFKEDGKVTAGNSSQIADGASALLIMNEEKAKAMGLRPRARFHAFTLAGTDPVTMLKGPIPATQ